MDPEGKTPGGVVNLAHLQGSLPPASGSSSSQPKKPDDTQSEMSFSGLGSMLPAGILDEEESPVTTMAQLRELVISATQQMAAAKNPLLITLLRRQKFRVLTAVGGANPNPEMQPSVDLCCTCGECKRIRTTVIHCRICGQGKPPSEFSDRYVSAALVGRTAECLDCLRTAGGRRAAPGDAAMRFGRCESCHGCCVLLPGTQPHASCAGIQLAVIQERSSTASTSSSTNANATATAAAQALQKCLAECDGQIEAKIAEGKAEKEGGGEAAPAGTGAGEGAPSGSSSSSTAAGKAPIKEATEGEGSTTDVAAPDMAPAATTTTEAPVDVVDVTEDVTSSSVATELAEASLTLTEASSRLTELDEESQTTKALPSAEEKIALEVIADLVEAEASAASADVCKPCPTDEDKEGGAEKEGMEGSKGEQAEEGRITPAPKHPELADVLKSILKKNGLWPLHEGSQSSSPAAWAGSSPPKPGAIDVVCQLDLLDQWRFLCVRCGGTERKSRLHNISRSGPVPLFSPAATGSAPGRLQQNLPRPGEKGGRGGRGPPSIGMMRSPDSSSSGSGSEKGGGRGGHQGGFMGFMGNAMGAAARGIGLGGRGGMRGGMGRPPMMHGLPPCQCGVVPRPGAQFCDNCGNRLHPSLAAAALAASGLPPAAPAPAPPPGFGPPGHMGGGPGLHHMMGMPGIQEHHFGGPPPQMGPGGPRGPPPGQHFDPHGMGPPQPGMVLIPPHVLAAQMQQREAQERARREREQLIRQAQRQQQQQDRLNLQAQHEQQQQQAGIQQQGGGWQMGAGGGPTPHGGGRPGQIHRGVELLPPYQGGVELLSPWPEEQQGQGGPPQGGGGPPNFQPGPGPGRGGGNRGGGWHMGRGSTS